MDSGTTPESVITATTVESGKSFNEMSVVEKREAVEKALKVLSDENVRADLNNRSQVVEANQVLNYAVKDQVEQYREFKSSLKDLKEGETGEKVQEEVGRVTTGENFGKILEIANKHHGETGSATGQTKVESQNVWMDVVDAYDLINQTEDPYGYRFAMNDTQKQELDEALKVREGAVRGFLERTAPKEEIKKETFDIKIDQAQKEKEVKEADTEFLKNLAARAKELREKRKATSQ